MSIEGIPAETWDNHAYPTLQSNRKHLEMIYMSLVAEAYENRSQQQRAIIRGRKTNLLNDTLNRLKPLGILPQTMQP